MYAKDFGMNIQYKIVEVWPNDHLIVARYWTDIITEEMLNSDPNSSNRKDDGSPIRCRTDVAISIPIPIPEEKELKELILKNAPIDFLKTLEKVQDPTIDTSMSKLLDLQGKTFMQEDADKIFDPENPSKELTEEEIEKLIALVTNK
jgi:hypothetical protein